MLREIETKNQVNQRKITDYFAVNRVTLTETCLKGTIIRLNEAHLSAGLDYLFQKASRELERNISRKY